MSEFPCSAKPIFNQIQKDIGGYPELHRGMTMAIRREDLPMDERLVLEVQGKIRAYIALHSAVEPPMQGYLCVFDLDGTLTGSNTTYEFVEFVLRHRMPKRYRVYAVLKPLFSIVGLLQGVAGLRANLNRWVMLRFIRGMLKEELYRLGKIYSWQVLRDANTSERRVIVTLMKTFASEHKVLIISKTIDPLTQLGQIFGVDMVTSQLRYINSRVNGLLRDIDKRSVIEEVLQSQRLRSLLIVTDDPEELLDIFPLKVFVVNRCQRKGKLKIARIQIQYKV